MNVNFLVSYVVEMISLRFLSKSSFVALRVMKEKNNLPRNSKEFVEIFLRSWVIYFFGKKSRRRKVRSTAREERERRNEVSFFQLQRTGTHIAEEEKKNTYKFS